MYKRSTICRELFSETVKLNDDISKLLRQQMVVSEDGSLFFGDEVVRSPGQLGIKVMQLIDHVRQENRFEPVKDLKYF